ncbi:MAG: cell division protein FtsX [Gammaproteobacteria bacterium]|nr:cell division protein FtsX [Gammaproteobacteria bacterium]
MINYLIRHLQVLFATLGAMRRTPVATINTIVIVAITLLLPALLYIAIKSGQQLSGNWHGQPQISVFIEQNITSQEAQLIFAELRLHPAIALAEYISPAQALEEFKALSGMDYELDFLDANPLPASIVLMPVNEYAESARLLSLKEQLSKIDGIESIRLDLDWTDRFNAILSTMTRIAALLAGLLTAALILIVSNTIRLLMLNRRQEIEITKLVGGSNAFVRRPFLYFGMLFGVLGALTTLLLLLSSAYILEPPLAHLAQLYNRESLIYRLQGTEILGIVLIGGMIGWLAARWSVARHLREIKPR